jgi:hypothetical protein
MWGIKLVLARFTLRPSGRWAKGRQPKCGRTISSFCFWPS